MQPVSNIDRIVHLLRQKLEERERKANQSNAGSAGPRPVGPRGIEALAAVNDTRNRQLRRTFIQTLLTDQLGEHLVNEAQFQQVVTRVTDAIEDDPATAQLLSRLIDDMKSRMIARKSKNP